MSWKWKITATKLKKKILIIIKKQQSNKKNHCKKKMMISIPHLKEIKNNNKINNNKNHMYDFFLIKFQKNKIKFYAKNAMKF